MKRRIPTEQKSEITPKLVEPANFGYNFSMVNDAIRQATNELERMRQLGVFKDIEIYLRIKAEAEEKMREFAKIIKNNRSGNSVVAILPSANHRNNHLTEEDINSSFKKIVTEILGEYDIKKKDARDSNRISLFLSPEGDLYRMPKEKYCYEMEIDSLRLKIMKILTDNYKKTDLLLEELNLKSYSSFYDAIRSINSKAKARLNIKDKMINGRKGSGFRINPKYNLTIE